MVMISLWLRGVRERERSGVYEGWTWASESGKPAVGSDSRASWKMKGV